MRTFIKLVAICGITLIQACGPDYENDFYKRISGITIPPAASLIETVDNGEYITVTSFKMTASDILNFSKKYDFEPVDGSYVPGFFGNSFLKGPKPEKNDLNNCFMKIGQKGKTGFVYVIDTARNILWAEINYPDWSGN